MNYKIALCDDDTNHMDELEKLLKKCSQQEDLLEIVKCTSGEQLLNSDIDNADVVFLDIQLKGMDGNEISVELRKRGYQGVLVHCSGIYMPTPETIKISPYRYILKQAEKEEVMKDLYDIFKEIARRKKVYSIEAYYKREKITVQTADITFITHHKNGKSILHVKESLEKIYSDGNIIAPYSFKELMNMLDKSDFAMPHSSYIVNLHYILGQREGDFIKIGTEMISISRSKKQEFKKKMMQYFGNKYPERNNG